MDPLAVWLMQQVGSAGGSTSGSVFANVGGQGVWVTPAHLSESVLDPAATSSTIGVMMGLGITILPVYSGRLMATITGYGQATGTAGGGNVQLCSAYGASPPANGAALTGTPYGNYVSFQNPSGATGGSYPFTVCAFPAGTPGDTIWIDVSLTATSGATASLHSITVTVIEF